jgi:hypothetical protein
VISWTHFGPDVGFLTGWQSGGGMKAGRRASRRVVHGRIFDVYSIY